MKKANFFNVCWLLLSVICISLPGHSSGQTYPYKFNYLTVEEGLSDTDTDANDIAQDRQGYIWVAPILASTGMTDMSPDSTITKTTRPTMPSKIASVAFTRTIRVRSG